MASKSKIRAAQSPKGHAVAPIGGLLPGMENANAYAAFPLLLPAHLIHANTICVPSNAVCIKSVYVVCEQPLFLQNAGQEFPRRTAQLVTSLHLSMESRWYLAGFGTGKGLFHCRLRIKMRVPAITGLSPHCKSWPTRKSVLSVRTRPCNQRLPSTCIRLETMVRQEMGWLRTGCCLLAPQLVIPPPKKNS